MQYPVLWRALSPPITTYHLSPITLFLPVSIDAALGMKDLGRRLCRGAERSTPPGCKTPTSVPIPGLAPGQQLPSPLSCLYFSFGSLVPVLQLIPHLLLISTPGFAQPQTWPHTFPHTPTLGCSLAPPAPTLRCEALVSEENSALPLPSSCPAPRLASHLPPHLIITPVPHLALHMCEGDAAVDGACTEPRRPNTVLQQLPRSCLLGPAAAAAAAAALVAVAAATPATTTAAASSAAASSAASSSAASSSAAAAVVAAFAGAPAASSNATSAKSPAAAATA